MSHFMSDVVPRSIYAGIYDCKGDWKRKSDVKNEAVGSVGAYLVNNVPEHQICFRYCGTRYVLKVEEVDE